MHPTAFRIPPSHRGNSQQPAAVAPSAGECGSNGAMRVACSKDPCCFLVMFLNCAKHLVECISDCGINNCRKDCRKDSMDSENLRTCAAQRADVAAIARHAVSDTPRGGLRAPPADSVSSALMLRLASPEAFTPQKVRAANKKPVARLIFAKPSSLALVLSTSDRRRKTLS